jgi:hypothetical protein
MSFKNQSSINEKHSLEVHIHEQSQTNEHNTNFLKGNAFFMQTHYWSTILENLSHFKKDKSLGLEPLGIEITCLTSHMFSCSLEGLNTIEC